MRTSRPASRSGRDPWPASLKIILELAKERWEAKQKKDYAKADSLRKSLQNDGWDVKDTPTDFELFPLNQ